jgi:hypothetical protein
VRTVQDLCEGCKEYQDFGSVQIDVGQHTFACWAERQMLWNDWFQEVVVEPLLRQAGIPSLPTYWTYKALEDLYAAMWRNGFTWSSQGRAAFGIECYGKHAKVRVKPNINAWTIMPKSYDTDTGMFNTRYQSEHQFNGNGGRRYYWRENPTTLCLFNSDGTVMVEPLLRHTGPHVVSYVPPLKEDGAQHDWDGYPYFHTIEVTRYQDADYATMDSHDEEMQSYIDEEERPDDAWW